MDRLALINDLRDEVLLKFWDKPHHHQEWVKDCFDVQPGDFVRARSQYDMQFTNAMVVDYEQRANDQKYVSVVTDPGSGYFQGSYMCRIDCIVPYKMRDGVVSN